MKAFIDRIFKAKKQKKILDEITHAEVKEVVVKAVKVKVPKEVEVPKEVKEKVIYNKPGHYFPDCNCFKCVRWRNQSA